jgi:TRAP-type C4-dicarboxylate transport system permease small subunit
MNSTSRDPPAFIRAFGALVDWTTVALGAGIVVLVFTNVVLHQIGHDIAWTTELTQLLMVWVTFMGGAAAARRGEHIAITEFVDLLAPRPHQWADAMAQLVAAFVLGLLIWYGIGIAQSAWVDQMSVLGWPMSAEYLGLPVGSAATLVFVLFDLTQIARGLPRAQRYGD